jgi:hypothetical protein
LRVFSLRPAPFGRVDDQLLPGPVARGGRNLVYWRVEL